MWGQIAAAEVQDCVVPQRAHPEMGEEMEVTKAQEARMGSVRVCHTASSQPGVPRTAGRRWPVGRLTG